LFNFQWCFLFVYTGVLDALTSCDGDTHAVFCDITNSNKCYTVSSHPTIFTAADFLVIILHNWVEV